MFGWNQGSKQCPGASGYNRKNPGSDTFCPVEFWASSLAIDGVDICVRIVYAQ